MYKVPNDKRGKVKLQKLRKKCVSGKVRFRDHKESVEVLHKSVNTRMAELRDQGYSKRNETRSYPCGLCAGYHLTSKESWSSKAVAA